MRKLLLSFAKGAAGPLGGMLAKIALDKSGLANSISEKIDGMTPEQIGWFGALVAAISIYALIWARPWISKRDEPSSGGRTASAQGRHARAAVIDKVEGDFHQGDNHYHEAAAKFSEEQTVFNIPESWGGGPGTLRLSNVARLKLYAAESGPSIACMLLDATPQSQGDLPEFVARVVIYNHEEAPKFVFDMNRTKRHIIDVGGTIFVVTLSHISVGFVTGMQGSASYTFLVVER